MPAPNGYSNRPSNNTGVSVDTSHLPSPIGMGERGQTYTQELKGVHEVYLDSKLIPQTPEKIEYEYVDQTEVIRLANQGNLTIPRKDAPMKITFEFVCTTEKYPFTWTVDYDRKRWTDYLWEIKSNCKPIDFEVIRHHESGNQSGTFNVSIKVLLTDWHFVEDASQDSDFIISVTLLEYFEQRNLEIDHDVQHHLIQNRNVRGWATSGGR